MSIRGVDVLEGVGMDKIDLLDFSKFFECFKFNNKFKKLEFKF